MVGLGMMAIIVSLPTIESRGVDGRFLAVVALMMVFLLIILGSRVLQNDFRQDADHLATLKTLPLPGNRIVGAEVLSSVLPISVVQLLLVVFAFAVTLGEADLPLDLLPRTALLLLAPLILLSVNATTVTIQNAAALLFPGWVRATPIVGGGIEVMGQGILATGMLLLTFIIALLPAAAASVGVWFLLPREPNEWIVAVLVAPAVLLGETWWAIRGLGRRFEKMEP
jgi:hypothetical protein